MESAKPQRGGTILLRYAAIPRPRRPPCRLQHKEPRSLSQRPGTPRPSARLTWRVPCEISGASPSLINGVEDHVHILCNLSRTVTIAGLVEAAKGGPSKWMKEQGSAYRDFYWQGGYGSFSVSQSNVEQVRAISRRRRSIIARCRIRMSFARFAGNMASRLMNDTCGLKRGLSRPVGACSYFDRQNPRRRSFLACPGVACRRPLA